MKLYGIQIDKNTLRMLRTDTPPDGAVEIGREPEEDKILSIEGGRAKYKNIPKPPRQPSLIERIEALEDKLK